MSEETAATPPTPRVMSPEQETYTRRPLVRILIGAAVAVALIAAAVVGAQALQTANRERAAERSVAEASALLDSAEENVLKVDEAVQVEVSSVVATQAIDAIALASIVRADLTEASVLIDRAMTGLPEGQGPLAVALKDSADARVEMMDAAPVILETDRKAAIAIPLADQAVAEIKAAEELTAQAVIEFNRHSADAVRVSDDLSAQAEVRLRAAQSLLTSATASFPGADYAAFGTYVEAKIGLIALAKEVDALWLAGDIEGSNTKLAAYNGRDAEIVAMAQSLPASARDPIANAYNAATAEASARYFEARERARSAGDRVDGLRTKATPN